MSNATRNIRMPEAGGNGWGAEPGRRGVLPGKPVTIRPASGEPAVKPEIVEPAAGPAESRLHGGGADTFTAIGDLAEQCLQGLMHRLSSVRAASSDLPDPERIISTAGPAAPITQGAMTMTALDNGAFGPDAPAVRPGALDQNPVSMADAYAHYEPLIGQAGDRTFMKLVSQWWDCLIAAETPEEKLTCERMIRAGYVSFGWHQWKRGRDLAEANRVRSEEHSAALMRESALARWR